MLNEIFYSECLGCKSRIDYTLFFCSDCLDDFELITKKCNACGSPLNINAAVCRNCVEFRAFDYMYCLYWYKGFVRDLFKAIKFRYSLKGGRLLHSMVSNTSCSIDDYDIITTVPSFITRKLRRFVHPADIIAKGLSTKSGIPFNKVLHRIRRTEFQWKMKKRERGKNVKGAFLPVKKVSGLKILLVDDIVTTGATLNECASVLKTAGAERVDCFAFARGVYL